MTIVKLSDRKIALVVKKLNDVLDEENINGPTWNRQVLKQLIIENIMTVENLQELINELSQIKEEE